MSFKLPPLCFQPFREIRPFIAVDGSAPPFLGQICKLNAMQLCFPGIGSSRFSPRFPWNEWIQWPAHAGQGWRGRQGSTRMEIERARSAERFRMGCKRGTAINSRAVCPATRANNTSSWWFCYSNRSRDQRPLAGKNRYSMPKRHLDPSRGAREPSIHARQSGTSGSCVAPGIPGKAASQKALPRIARFPLSSDELFDHSINRDATLPHFREEETHLSPIIDEETIFNWRLTLVRVGDSTF